MEDIIIEGLNVYIEEIRGSKGIECSSFLILLKQIDSPGFGGFSTIKWSVILVKGKEQSILFQVSVRARPKTDDYWRELRLKLMIQVASLIKSEDFNRIIDGTK